MPGAVVLEATVPIPAIGASRGDRLIIHPNNPITLALLKPTPAAPAPLRLIRGGAR